MKRTMLVVLLAVVALGLMATSAFAATSGVVNINASVNKAITLTIVTNTLTFGPIDPGSSEDQTAQIAVRSNFDYIINRTPDAASFASNGFSLETPGFATGGDEGRTGSTPATFNDVYRFTANWDMDPEATYSSHIDYTVVTK